MIPGVLVLFMLLITVYSIGTELKFGRAREWIQMADYNIFVALTGKLLPQTLIFLSIFLGFEWYIYGYLNFPHPGGLPMILLIAVLTVLSSQGFGAFAFGLMPSLRMSMSVCSLWAVVGFSACGATFPLFAMDGMIQALAEIIPSTSLLYDLSDMCFQWLSTDRRMAECHHSRWLCMSSYPHNEEP